MIFCLKAYALLSKAELYAVLRLRAEVFVVEQHCPFNDLDGHDEQSHHLLGYMQGQLAGYARIIPPHTLYTEASIGRVVVGFEHRHTGAGKRLMAEGVACCRHLHAGHAIKIMAQQYLQGFYSQFGFRPISEPFLEDNIWHVHMLLARTQAV